MVLVLGIVKASLERLGIGIGVKKVVLLMSAVLLVLSTYLRFPETSFLEFPGFLPLSSSFLPRHCQRHFQNIFKSSWFKIRLNMLHFHVFWMDLFKKFFSDLVLHCPTITTAHGPPVSVIVLGFGVYHAASIVMSEVGVAVFCNCGDFLVLFFSFFFQPFNFGLGIFFVFFFE